MVIFHAVYQISDMLSFVCQVTNNG